MCGDRSGDLGWKSVTVVIQDRVRAQRVNRDCHGDASGFVACCGEDATPSGQCMS